MVPMKLTWDHPLYYASYTYYVHVLLNRQEVGSEVCLFVPEAQFPPDVVPVGLNRSAGNIQQLCYVLARFPLFHQICHLKLRRGEIQIFRGQRS